jgi:hypothetical protein
VDDWRIRYYELRLAVIQYFKTRSEEDYVKLEAEVDAYLMVPKPRRMRARSCLLWAIAGIIGLVALCMVVVHLRS